MCFARIKRLGVRGLACGRLWVTILNMTAWYRLVSKISHSYARHMALCRTRPIPCLPYSESNPPSLPPSYHPPLYLWLYLCVHACVNHLGFALFSLFFRVSDFALDENWAESQEKKQGPSIRPTSIQLPSSSSRAPETHAIQTSVQDLWQRRLSLPTNLQALPSSLSPSGVQPGIWGRAASTRSSNLGGGAGHSENPTADSNSYTGLTASDGQPRSALNSIIRINPAPWHQNDVESSGTLDTRIAGTHTGSRLSLRGMIILGVFLLAGAVVAISFLVFHGRSV
jgi:hypothetical protein